MFLILRLAAGCVYSNSDRLSKSLPKDESNEPTVIDKTETEGEVKPAPIPDEPTPPEEETPSPCESPSVSELSPEGMPGAPSLLKASLYQGPVRGDPDDLLTLTGSGFAKGDTVVYRRLEDTTQPLDYPDGVPSTNGPAEGVAPIVKLAGNGSLAVKLPAEMIEGASYGLWVRTTDGKWSAGVRINDARPIWISPAVSYETAKIAGLPREIKVVGRNLQARPGAKTRVTLKGPQTYTFPAAVAADPDSAADRYTAHVKLPASMPAGTYSVGVTRDGVGCVPLEGRFLTIRKDPVPKTDFPVDDPKFGGCKPTDGQDDTACIVKAIGEAAKAGGGRVLFGPGTWDLKPDPSLVGTAVDIADGIVVPQKVDLAGAGADKTHVVQSLLWQSKFSNNIPSVFTLQGENVVQGIDFVGDYNKPAKSNINYISIGKMSDTQTVSDVQIFDNKFSGMYFAFGNWGASLKNFFVVSNEIHPSRNGFFMAGGGPATVGKFRIEDSVIAFNLFLPGDYKADDGVLWPIASELSGAYGLEFSHNEARGTKTHPFRAGFFWSMHSNNERLLVAQNKLTCTETWDAEAITFDENGAVDGSSEPFQVASATKDSVSVLGDWLNKTPDFYKRHWVFIADGKGLGQARRITGYTVGKVSVITISPEWDVLPESGSIAVVKRNSWQATMVDNVVDLRGCAKNNPMGNGGSVGWYTNTDSAMEGNRLYDSNGVLVWVINRNDAARTMMFSLEIRGNLIDGEYDPTQKGGWGGLNLVDSSAFPQIPSPVLGYNVAVSHNTVVNAETAYHAGISMRPGFHPPTTPYVWKGISLFHNTIKNVPNWGISIDSKFVWDTLLYKNAFEGVDPSKKVSDKGSGTAEVE